jgi:hypothetical protein
MTQATCRAWARKKKKQMNSSSPRLSRKSQKLSSKPSPDLTPAPEGELDVRIILAGIGVLVLIGGLIAFLVWFFSRSTATPAPNPSPPPPNGFQQGICNDGYYDVTQGNSPFSTLRWSDGGPCSTSCQWLIRNYDDEDKACLKDGSCTCLSNATPPPSNAPPAVMCPPGTVDVSSKYIIPAPSFGLICSYEAGHFPAQAD